MASTRDLVKRDGPFCIWCKRHLNRYDRSRDHLVPRSLGGSLEMSNLVLSCRFCNSSRGHTDPWVWGDAMLHILRTYPNDPRPAELAVRHLQGKPMPSHKARTLHLQDLARRRAEAAKPKLVRVKERKQPTLTQRVVIPIDCQGRFLDPKRYQV